MRSLRILVKVEAPSLTTNETSLAILARVVCHPYKTAHSLKSNNVVRESREQAMINA